MSGSRGRWMPYRTRSRSIARQFSLCAQRNGEHSSASSPAERAVQAIEEQTRTLRADCQMRYGDGAAFSADAKIRNRIVDQLTNRYHSGKWKKKESEYAGKLIKQPPGRIIIQKEKYIYYPEV